MVTVQTYRVNQLPLTIDAAQGFWVEWLHTKRNKNLAGQENQRSPDSLHKQD